jgi:hypothetical protein
MATINVSDVFFVPLLDTSGASTFGEFIIKSFSEMVREPENFSGYRPFGNSEWDYMIFESLVAAGKLSANADFQWEGIPFIRAALDEFAAAFKVEA